MTLDLFADAPALPRELVLASAGSGKTFRISSRILGLLAGGAPPDEVFASTFTRKAAGEILGRVLDRLSAAALDETSAAELSAHALLRPAATPLSAAEWQAVLVRLIRSLHRLNVGTLDAFFVRVATAFAQEAGLPPGWRIAEETELDAVRADAIDDVLRTADRAELVALLRGINRERAVRSVHDGLARQAVALLEILDRLDPHAPDPWDALGRALGPLPPVTESERLAAAGAIRGIEVPRTRTGAPNRNWVKCIGDAAAAVEAEEWTNFLENTLIQRAREGAEGYSGQPIEVDAQVAIDEGSALARRELGRRLVEQSRALGRLADHLADALARRQRERGAYRFGDLTRLLGDPDLWARSDLHYRLDGRLRHLLLDEFQDTSLAQWEVLEPLLEELLAGHADERAAIVVADPKQSIYGWRGAEPLLVRHLETLPGIGLADPLATSWRSSPVVLRTVNDMFRDIAANPVFEARDHGTVDEWAESFTEHVAARDELPGYVRIEAGPRGDGRGGVRPELCEYAARRVKELREQAPGFSIGVLTRSNDAVARMIFELRELKIEASEEGGNPLTDSPAVAAVLALLRMADHPGDRISRYHVATTRVGAAVGLTDYSDRDATAKVSKEIRRRLVDDGYGPTLDELACTLAPACDPRDRRRLRQLVERAYRHDAEGVPQTGAPAPPDLRLRPSDFVHTVARERIEDPLRTDVRVMTVHQAKGLEFDIVVLPQLDVGFLKNGGGTAPLPHRPEPVGRATAVFPPLSEAVRTLFEDVPELQEACAQRRAAELRDGLSGLYVAMTRTRHALHLIVCADGERPSTAKTLARAVREVFAPGRMCGDGDVLHEDGDPCWHLAAEPREPAAPARESAAPPPVRLAGGGRTRFLPRRKPSGHDESDHVELALLLDLGTEPALRAGRIAHAWFEQIEWIEDGVPEDGALRAVARAIAPEMRADALDALLARFRGWLAAPEVRRVLSRAAYPAGATVEREMPFVVRDGGALVEGVIDRLVLVHEDGRVARAEIVDFKTDALDGSDRAKFEERVGYYRGQMEVYRRAVGGLYGVAGEAVGAKLVTVEAGRVVL
jgi:ATP-dependent helicase/nuclease subunit A